MDFRSPPAARTCPFSLSENSVEGHDSLNNATFMPLWLNSIKDRDTSLKTALYDARNQKGQSREEYGMIAFPMREAWGGVTFVNERGIYAIPVAGEVRFEMKRL